MCERTLPSLLVVPKFVREMKEIMMYQMHMNNKKLTALRPREPLDSTTIKITDAMGQNLEKTRFDQLSKQPQCTLHFGNQ